MQEFLEEYSELMAADEYDTKIPRVTIVPTEGAPRWRADFVHATINQVEFSKVVELKTPRLKLTKKSRGGHMAFAAKVRDNICHLRDY